VDLKSQNGPHCRVATVRQRNRPKKERTKFRNSANSARKGCLVPFTRFHDLKLVNFVLDTSVRPAGPPIGLDRLLDRL
jgi:hypothetical protein